MPKKLDLSDEQIQKVETLAGFGLTQGQISAVLGMSARSFAYKRKDIPRFNEAYEKGKAVAAAKIGQALFVKATAGDVQAIRWYEMTRLGMTEASRQEHSIETPSSIRVTFVEPNGNRP